MNKKDINNLTKNLDNIYNILKDASINIDNLSNDSNHYNGILGKIEQIISWGQPHNNTSLNGFIMNLENISSKLNHLKNNMVGN